MAIPVLVKFNDGRDPVYLNFARVPFHGELLIWQDVKYCVADVLHCPYARGEVHVCAATIVADVFRNNP